MKSVELQLSDQTVSKLQEAAEHLSLSVEAFILVVLEERLSLLDPEFLMVSDYVLKKNAELYRRLA